MFMIILLAFGASQVGAVSSPHPTLLTPGDFPFPFGAPPVDLGDGTSIGDRPREVLLSDAPPQYTTLDKLFLSRPPQPPSSPQDNIPLGGLHPDEVFYADKDILVIRGAGFSPQGSTTYLSDNAIAPATTQVRPETLFSEVPLPFKFLNGNIATIVKPGAATNGNDIDAIEFNDEAERLVAEPSLTSEKVMEPLTKSTNNNNNIRKRQVERMGEFVHYQYQQLGNQPIVHYQINRNGNLKELPMGNEEAPRRSDREEVLYDLEGDIEVNYKPPLPPRNDKDAEGLLRESEVVPLSNNPTPPK